MDFFLDSMFNKKNNWYFGWKKSGDHQLRLVVYSGIYRVSKTSQVVVWGVFQEQYFFGVHGYSGPDEL